MAVSLRLLKIIVQIFLLAVVGLAPLMKSMSLYFPYISLKAYLFRGLVLLALFFWLWLILKEKKYHPQFKNLLVLSILLFFLAQVIVALLGVDPLYSFFSDIARQDGVLQYGFWVLYFLMLISVFQEKKDWQWLLVVFVISSFINAFYSWWQTESIWRVGYGFFGNHAYFAAYLIFGIGFSLLLLAERFFKNWWLNVLFLANALFLTLTLIFTQIRGAYFGLGIGFVLFAFFSLFFLSKEYKKIKIFTAGTLLLGIISLVLVFSFQETAFVQNQPLLKRITDISRVWEVSSVSDRLLTWQIALKGFKDKPIFGWGPENFGAINNKYYDYRVGLNEPWFDRAHNQVLDILATGGIFLFLFYLFWLTAVSYFIFKISQQKKILGFLLASIFLAYFGQGLFLFDTIGAYLGLFPFLGFLFYQNNQLTKKETDFSETKKKNNYQKKAAWCFLLPVGLLILLAIYWFSYLPFQANHLAWNFYNFNANQLHQVATPYLLEAFKIKSPYTYWEVRKKAGFELLFLLDSIQIEKISTKDLETLNSFYNFITPELEKFIIARPYEQQGYYVLGALYRLGSEKLGRDDLAKAERVFKQGLNYTNLRLEYYNELGMILFKQGKLEEAEELMKDYISRLNPNEYFPYLVLGHFYTLAEKYNLAMEQYKKAEERGCQFVNNQVDYERYLLAADGASQYQALVEMAERYLEKKGPDADTYYNIAVGYFKLGEKEKAREFWQRAVELNKEEYEKYRPFFE